LGFPLEFSFLLFSILLTHSESSPIAEVPQRPVLGSAATAGLRLAGAAAGAAERAAAGGGTWIHRVDGCAEQFLPLGDAQLIPFMWIQWIHFRVSILMEVPKKSPWL